MGGGVVGSVSYEIKNKDHVYISGLAIRSEFRGQGLVRQAMGLLFAELTSFKKFSLVVHPDNHAVKLYKSFGFKKETLVEDYFGDGEPRLVMVKDNNI